MLGKFLTDTGHVRSHNEDSGGIYENKQKQILAIVADGMGGHSAGDVASSLATTELHKRWKETDSITSPEQAQAWLEKHIKEANQTIFRYAIEHEECKGMGTTVVAAICTEEFITIGHIGDSRCYLSNSHGFTQVTEDHSLVNELVKTGQLSPEDAEHHPRKHVLLKALGTEESIEIDTKTIGWEENNYLILCSDGLTNKVEDDELHQFVVESDSIDEALNKLVNLANERGGEDNISLSIVQNIPLTKEGE
ncbi:Stp1/IreP family PP2C-type Ser/Thr phosphatase [Salinibacillus xinjiangensis]|uniref:protein-serine/threonine phosphatase n=1 Tax=Salinibacillus xinjiangensis TaxID=1229268 RepID=A0A6G1X3F3_9BACI|nr:Stp1/IreP family PP2C-type Ser/Thr phosphatase [Salinibacillus xinjiangensis]MRG85449.1 Stp1/IreP family PP2C-type Ser/Thr phosphatase [Salinibacillus xinjiangensis]